MLGFLGYSKLSKIYYTFGRNSTSHDHYMTLMRYIKRFGLGTLPLETSSDHAPKQEGGTLYRGSPCPRAWCITLSDATVEGIDTIWRIIIALSSLYY